jgi:hypothetical protein
MSTLLQFMFESKNRKYITGTSRSFGKANTGITPSGSRQKVNAKLNKEV